MRVRRAVLVAVTLPVIALFAASCSDQEPSAPREATLQVAEAAFQASFQANFRSDTLIARPTLAQLDSRIVESAAWKRVEWVGRAHTRALLAMTEQRAQVRSGGDRAKCDALRRVMFSLHRHLLEAGHIDGTVDRSAAASAADSQQPCAAFRRPLSVFGPLKPRVSLTFSESRVSDSLVTAAVMPYLEQIRDIADTYWTPEEVGTAVNTVLGSAVGLNFGELEVLYGFANFTVETTDYWTAYDNAGGFCENPDTSLCAPGGGPAAELRTSPLSVFGTLQRSKRGDAIAVDVAAGFLSAVSNILFVSTPMGCGFILGRAVLTGAAASIPVLMS